VLEVHKSINKARTFSEKASSALKDGRARAATAGLSMPKEHDTHDSLMGVIEDMRNEIRYLRETKAPEPVAPLKPKRIYKKKEPVDPIKIDEKKPESVAVVEMPEIHPVNTISFVPEAAPVNKRRAEYEEKIKQQDTRLDLLKAMMRRK